MYPVRGAVTWKSTVGTNVASDALANLASGGVTGGALVIVGEDYGEGSSIMQERTHAFAMKSQIWLLDPRPNLESMVDAVEHGFQLSEASNTPVILQLRIRSCHVHGRFITKENKRPEFTLQQALDNPERDVSRIVLPPASFLHEQEKVKNRWPAAVKFIKENKLNEFFDGDLKDVGLILQGGLYNGVIRSLQLLGLADHFGNSRIPLYVMNVTYPVIDDEIKEFCADKKAVLLLEEGQPNYIEQNLHTILRQAGLNTILSGKDLLPVAGEYTTAVMRDGLQKFLENRRQACWPVIDVRRDGKDVPGIAQPEENQQATATATADISGQDPTSVISGDDAELPILASSDRPGNGSNGASANGNGSAVASANGSNGGNGAPTQVRPMQVNQVARRSTVKPLNFQRHVAELAE